MKDFNSASTVFALALAIGASFIARDAHATSKARTTYTNPTAICQAALPAFEGVIRKRPLAVQNEGSTNAFITCSFTSQGPTITTVRVHFSGNASPHALSCTGVSGDNGGPNQFIVKNITIGEAGILTWTGPDFAGAPIYFPSSKFNISCNLLPGVGINDSELSFFEDVGA